MNQLFEHTWAPIGQELYEGLITSEEAMDPHTAERSDALNGIYYVLTLIAIPALLPEIREWLKLPLISVALFRQKLENRLKEYAKEKELDYSKAEQAAAKITAKVDPAFFRRVIQAYKTATSTEQDSQRDSK
ncbi:MAG: hypothetical protein ACSHYA_18930 [Opitutaceae bacterium]